jgi:hypothetical protein
MLSICITKSRTERFPTYEKFALKISMKRGSDYSLKQKNKCDIKFNATITDAVCSVQKQSEATRGPLPYVS